MLSQTAEYALRAVLYLADHQGEGLVPVGAMADALGIPQNYLSKTLQALARTGVLSSVRGPAGGFRLGRAASAIPLLAVVAPFDSIDERRRCLLGNPTCNDATACAAHDRWRDTSERVATFFRTTMVADLRRRTAPNPRPSPRRRHDRATR